MNKIVLTLQTLLKINTIMEKKQYFAPEAEAWVVMLERTILSVDKVRSTNVEDAEVVNGTW